jgi:hypothetical protein
MMMIFKTDWSGVYASLLPFVLGHGISYSKKTGFVLFLGSEQTLLFFCREANLMSSNDVSQRKSALSRLLAIGNDADCPPAVQQRVSHPCQEQPNSQKHVISNQRQIP